MIIGTRILIGSFLCSLVAAPLYAGRLEFPAPTKPGKAKLDRSGETCTLSNNAISVTLHFSSGVPSLAKVENKLTGEIFAPNSPAFSIKMDRIKDIWVADGQPVVSKLEADPKATREGMRYAGRQIASAFRNGPFRVVWKVELRDDSNYVKSHVSLTADKGKSAHLRTVVLFDGELANAKATSTSVKGSPILAGNGDTLFVSVMHPISTSRVVENKAVSARNLRLQLDSEHPFGCDLVLGVTPKGQTRRGFLYFLERERAHPYRFYLHYNSWFDLNIGRPKTRMYEPEAMASIKLMGTELVTKRGVKMDGFVMDDGWDSHTNVWHFHKGFPEGFKNIGNLAKSFGAGIGVWMSPCGGYFETKKARTESGAKMGLEVVGGSFSMSGPNYHKLFVSTASRMMTDYGVNFFKFDGMGGGSGPNIEAVFDVTRELRKINPDVFISATIGTWASPFWLMYADSIWRQKSDFGRFGKGNRREKWITYRDMIVHDHIVEPGPLYPLNSIMFHGVIVSRRSGPAGGPIDPLAFRHEVRAAFGCGSGIQELYITPDMPAPGMWDDLADAAKWSRRNIDTLVDTHWIGGNPGKLEVYGWASWNKSKGVLVLRNPSDKAQTFELDVAKVFELPEGAPTKYKFAPSYKDLEVDPFAAEAGKPVALEIKPLDLLIFTATPAD
jgi:hypothetical protein